MVRTDTSSRSSESVCCNVALQSRASVTRNGRAYTGSDRVERTNSSIAIRTSRRSALIESASTGCVWRCRCFGRRRVRRCWVRRRWCVVIRRITVVGDEHDDQHDNEDGCDRTEDRSKRGSVRCVHRDGRAGGNWNRRPQFAARYGRQHGARWFNGCIDRYSGTTDGVRPYQSVPVSTFPDPARVSIPAWQWIVCGHDAPRVIGQNVATIFDCWSPLGHGRVGVGRSASKTTPCRVTSIALMMATQKGKTHFSTTPGTGAGRGGAVRMATIGRVGRGSIRCAVSAATRPDEEGHASGSHCQDDTEDHQRDGEKLRRSGVGTLVDLADHDCGVDEDVALGCCGLVSVAPVDGDVIIGWAGPTCTGTVQHDGTELSVVGLVVGADNGIDDLLGVGSRNHCLEERFPRSAGEEGLRCTGTHTRHKDRYDGDFGSHTTCHCRADFTRVRVDPDDRPGGTCRSGPEHQHQQCDGESGWSESPHAPILAPGQVAAKVPRAPQHER
jgi:hypothetical protein